MVVYHAMILVDLVALSFGVGIILVTMLSWERSGIRWMRDLAFMLAAAASLLMGDIFRIYMISSGWPQDLAGRLILAFFAGVGNLGLVVTIPLFVRSITSIAQNRIRWAFEVIGMALFPLAGVLDELIDLPVFHVLNDIGMALLLVTAAVNLAIGYRRIAEPEARRMVKQMMWLTIATIILGRTQLTMTSFLGVTLELRRVRIVQVVYYVGLLIVILIYSVKHLFRPSGTQDYLPAADFLEQRGISNRERDVMSMIMQGHPNRIIGERLFISDRTVKNHVSSIYRKTGAANRVQLMNMVRNHLGPRADPAATPSASRRLKS